ncbi:MAG: hypothetical protein ACD_30C00051G0005 [uncultured bacterium]|uniref:Glutamine--fructose-6-phosphate aminotransferase [isomerizing] n=4 Tax=Candidatus Daviesiibacteriota TaxID=1752718 RepID=A0A0G0EUD4_9BACT|nr:MAG: hypothetical protein ACD_30C00051G0005 [uncultured bacterium]KKQ09182.1 MAG: Glucosamine/fructose-6-phosphate aminotransferase, isomerizing [Candidatus Daviesbacteria bacterium GW2011_GWB1_36_5]KKQ14780.1 MAG: Glucosamine/fructose-6-phosphate aminotransferase, isomerizing [Candidatus Daviesbacteria bacterium GW2011_GWA1_36_8]OGE16416.1 MAG: glutamine--fructose-6-phosphate transaminase (isomerizing) [Candidatus Daviesbacteria bacterium RIFCSPHIGHO2_01_FULL_36_37]OGE35335.1 MAG: glutamine
MCGIFGIIGSDSDAPLKVFSGLKDIEYRGYDSWGIAFPNGKNFKVIKKTGFLPNHYSLPPSPLSLGHTRWATHGGVTQENAHPHSDCTGKVVLVHNGIVENYLDFKKSLTSHKFKSETDSEVMVHLIEDELKRTKEFKTAVANVFNKLDGLNAIVVADGKEIVAAKIGSPLVIGKNKDGFLLASDPNALLLHTNKLLFLEDNQMAVLNKKIELFSLPKMQKITPRFKTVDWKHTKSDLGKYPHFMLKEINEQPEVLKRVLKNTAEIKEVSDLIKKAQGTYLIGCGTAAYACIAGTYLFSKYAKFHVNFAAGSEFNFSQDFLNDKSLLIAISQSGESIDVVEPVTSAKAKGTKVVSLVNVLGSTLFRMSHKPVLLNAGVEKGVASTKAFISMVAHMILLSLSMVGKQTEAKKIILDSAKEIERILKKSSEIKKLADEIKKSKNIYVLGRGLNYPIALESALKIKEISYIHAEGFAGGELKHGVIALIEKDTPVIVYVPEDETKGSILANAMEVKARGAYVIGAAAQNNPIFDFYFEVKDVGASSILPSVVFAQLLAYHLSTGLGLNPDKPRNLAKSVVVR